MANFQKFLRKKTQYLMNTLYDRCCCPSFRPSVRFVPSSVLYDLRLLLLGAHLLDILKVAIASKFSLEFITEAVIPILNVTEHLFNQPLSPHFGPFLTESLPNSLISLSRGHQGLPHMRCAGRFDFVLVSE